MKIVRLLHDSTHTELLVNWNKLRAEMQRENHGNTRLKSHPISILPSLNIDTDKNTANWFFGYYFPEAKNLELPCILVSNDKEAHKYTGLNCIEEFRSELLR